MQDVRFRALVGEEKELSHSKMEVDETRIDAAAASARFS